MKKILLMMVMLMTAVFVSAQTATDATPDEQFFIGNWELFVEGLPQGDTKMMLKIEKVDGKLQGAIGGTDGSGMNKLTKAEVKGKTLNVNFMGGGYDVPMYLDREKDGTISGSMNDMFDVTGKKMENKQ